MTEMDSYGIPQINDILQDQVQKRMFTVLALKHSYHQMKLAEAPQDVTTMSKLFGTYQWLVMPIGMKKKSAAFQRLLGDVVKDSCVFARAFVADIIVSSVVQPTKRPRRTM